jgi:hypothetical protein
MLFGADNQAQFLILGKVSRAMQIAHDVGMRYLPIPKLGPWELKDEFCAGVAVIMVNNELHLS